MTSLTAFPHKISSCPRAPRRSAAWNTTSAEWQPGSVDELNNLPVKTVNGAVIFMRDVAHVRDGFRRRPTSCARMACAARSFPFKNGQCLHARYREQVRADAAAHRGPLLAESAHRALFDQSLFVRAAIAGVIQRGRHRRLPDRADDPALPRRLAAAPSSSPSPFPLSILAALVILSVAGRDDQYHDPRRPRARGRHSRR